MKRTIAILLSMCCLNGNVFAATRSEQSQELQNLISECEDMGLSVDYEKSAAQVFDTFIPYEEEDKTNSYISDSQRSYNSSSMTKIYKETKQKLEDYISGGKKPLPAVPAYGSDSVKVKGNIFVNSEGEPLFTAGFGHSSDVFDDEDALKIIGSGNIQTEVGITSTTQYSSVYMWNVTKNNGCDADAELVKEDDGNAVLRIVNRSAANDDKYVLISQVVPVKPNTKYIYSFDAVSEGETPVEVFTNDFAGRDKVFKAGTDKKTYKAAKPFTTGADQNYITFMLAFDYGDPIKIDNITVTNMSTKENAVKNGDFEGTGNYYFHANNIKRWIERTKSAHEKGYSIDLLLGTHYVPEYMRTLNPDLNNNSPYGFNFNIAEPNFRQMVRDHVEFVLSLLPNVDSVCISNEPNFCSSGIYDYFNPIFREWMREKYSNDISKLNAAHGKSYSSFSDVSIPEYLKNTSGYPQADPMFYDYMLFNEEVFADWHRMIADSVRKIRPDLPIHSKVQDYLFTYAGASVAKMLFGTDAELFDEFCDIAGNDATTYVSEPRSRLGTMMWYDFLSSVTDKPVYNSEDHVITDYDSTFSDETAQNVRYELLNGAVHGRGLSSLWTWQRGLEGNIVTLFKYFPYATYKAGQSMLDLKRLGGELAAFVTADKDTAFFYSKASRVMTIYNTYSDAYEEALEADYAAVNAMGHKIGFVTERHPEKLANYKTLILPNVQYMPEPSVAEIARFMRNGGNVIIDGTDPLAYTEYGVAASSADREYIRNNAYYVSARTTEEFNRAYANFGEDTSFVYEGSKPASGIDLKRASCDGTDLTALVNVTDSEKTVSLSGKYINLYDMSEYDGTIVLKPYEPMLLAEKIDRPTVNAVTDIKADYVNFKVDYSYTSTKELTVSVAARDSDGKIVGAAYCRKQVYENENNEFSGSISAENVNSVEVTIYDTKTNETVAKVN